VTHNTCPTKWDPPVNMDGTDSSVSCVGIATPIGTGPFKLGATTTRSDGSISEVSFLKNANWWGVRGNIEELVVKNYNTSADVKQALLAKELDMVVGGGVLTPTQVKEFSDNHGNDFQVVMGPPLMNKIIVMNAAKVPTDDIELRKTVMHAVQKSAIVDSKLAGSAKVADSLFPKDAPYCDVDLTPRYDYDLQKAELLNCPAEETESDGLSGGEIAGIVVGSVLGAVCLIGGVGAAAFFSGRKSGYKLYEKLNPKKSEETTPADTIGNGASAL